MKRFLKEGYKTKVLILSWQHGENPPQLTSYQVNINQWLNFCKNYNINSQDASLHFLTSPYQNGKQYRTISCARSILSLFIRSNNGLNFGKQSIVQRFMKDIYQLRPSVPVQFYLGYKCIICKTSGITA